MRRTISASSIKTFESCSWLWYCNYQLRLPQKNNDGALRGTCVHLVLELLLTPRHRKHFDIIFNQKHAKHSKALSRLILKTLKKLGALNTQNYDMCLDMVTVGCLNTDFFGKGAKLGEPEYKFEIDSKSPDYAIKGFIDKMFFYPDNSITIVDYKSSKKKFKGDELDGNIQAFTYSLAAYKMFKPDAVKMEFNFLRYPKEPVQRVVVTKEQLAGFEQYLAYIYKETQDFDETKAQTNFAAKDEDKNWLCKAGTWECPYYRAFNYYALIDATGKIIKTNFTNIFEPKDGEVVKKYRYNGCAAFRDVL